MHHVSCTDLNRSAVDRPIPDVGVVFAVLTTRINRGGQVGNECLIDLPTGEGWVQLVGHDTRHDGLKAFCYEIPDQLSGVPSPDREHRLHIHQGQFFFTPSAKVFEKNITKSDRFHTLFLVSQHGVTHQVFVPLIDAGAATFIGQVKLFQRQSDPLSLPIDQLTSYPVVADPVVSLSHRCHQAHHLVAGITPEGM